MTPAVAYTLVVLGVLLVYVELFRPGMVVPGVCGLAIACLGAYELWLHTLRPGGVTMCVMAAALIAAEILWNLRCLAGGLGTAALIAGSICLCGGGLPLPLTFSGGLVVGIGSTLLARSARRARQNKAAGVITGN